MKKSLPVVNIKVCAVLVLMLMQFNSTAQVFLETFNEAPGATTGFDNISGVAWTATCPGSLDANDYLKVVGGQMENQDSNGPALWETTTPIDISTCALIEITFDIEEDDEMEACGTGCNAVDWIQLEYNIDNTGWQTPSNSFFCAGPCADVNVIHSDDILGGAMSYSSGCINGGTNLQLRITTQTWSGTERWRFDNVTVTCGSNPVVSAGPDVTICNGQSVTLTATNPDAAVISWNNGINDGIPFSPGVGSNYFTVTATAGVCSAVDSALVTVVPGPDFALTVSPSSSCAPPFDGIITISGLNPGTQYDLTYVDTAVVGPTTYTANGSGQIVLINVGPNSYGTFIIDSLGCITVNTNGVVINPPFNPSVDAGLDQTICEGDSVLLYADNPDNGNINWDNGVTDSVYFAPGVGSVVYTVTTEISGCTSQDDVTVNVLAIPTVSVNPAGPFAFFDGIQNLISSPAGGTWSASCGACINSTTGDFDPALAGIGSHTICYTAGTAPCEDSMCITIYINDGCALTGTITSGNPTCFGDPNGSVTVNTLFSTGNIVFVIEDSLGNQVNIGNSNTANLLTEGWYYITVTDDFPCTYIDSVLLQSPGQITADLDFFEPDCYGVPNGMVVVDTVYNYTGNYDSLIFIWNSTSQLNIPGDDTLFNAGGDSYNLLLNDSSGCSVTIDFDLPYPAPIIIEDIGTQPAYCRLHGGQSGSGIVYAAASGGTPSYTYEWLDLQDSSTWANSTWGGLNPGLYEITATDVNGCVVKQTITLDSLNPQAAFELSSPQFTADYKGTAPVEVHFVNQSMYFSNPNDPNADSTFSWNFGFGNWTTSYSYFEELDTTYASSGVYTACLVATNKNGCTDTACVPIIIYDLQSFVPVNVFTPNGDGANDFFSFENLSVAIEEFYCVIVNRWGITIKEFNSITDTWDGTDKSGSLSLDGVYFYTYRAVAQSGEVLEGQGNVQLIRK